MPKWLILILCIILPLAVGFTSGYLTRNESGGPWFNALQKPSFNPPSWLFGPVWTTLYILMGISLYFVVQSAPSTARTMVLVIFAVQLVLNFFWSLLFFRYHLLGVASVEIVLLWFAIVAMIVTFYRVSPISAYLQIPNIAWVSFATVLCLSIFLLNRTSA